jgi:hypothetical protein
MVSDGVDSDDPVGQGPAMHQAHDEVIGSVMIHGQFVHRNDVGMIELSLNLRLGMKTLDVLGVSRQGRRKHLDGHLAQQVAIANAMNRPHPASPDLVDILEPLLRLPGQNPSRVSIGVGRIVICNHRGNFAPVRLGVGRLLGIGAAFRPVG